MYTAAMMAPPIEPYVVAEPRATRRLLLIAEVLLYQMVLTKAGEHNPAAAAAPPANVYYWPLKNATSANGAALSYEERALALAFQGIVNAKDGVGHAQHQSQQPPTLFFDAVSAGTGMAVCTVTASESLSSAVVRIAAVQARPGVLWCLIVRRAGRIGF